MTRKEKKMMDQYELFNTILLTIIFMCVVGGLLAIVFEKPCTPGNCAYVPVCLYDK